MSTLSPELIREQDALLTPQPPQKADTSLFEQVSNAPKRFHLSLLLLMAWAGIALALTPMMPVELPSPGPWLVSQAVVLKPYVFQIPLVVLLSGVFGYRYGGMVLFLTLLAGFLGLPVFAAGGGMAYWLQPTVGYLLGFLWVPFLLRKPMRRALKKKDAKLYWLIPAGAMAVAAIHLTGILGLVIHHAVAHLPWTTLIPTVAQYSNLMALYDIAFAITALMLTRVIRLVLWPGLY